MVPPSGSRFHASHFDSRSSLQSVAGCGRASDIPTLNFAKSAKFRWATLPFVNGYRVSRWIKSPPCRKECDKDGAPGFNVWLRESELRSRGIQYCRRCVALQAAPRLSTSEPFSQPVNKCPRRCLPPPLPFQSGLVERPGYLAKPLGDPHH